jgi:hypothetical protein
VKQIQQWLAGPERDYTAGVALFEAHGRSGVLKRLLAGTCTDYTREVLERELRKLLCDGHVISVPEKAPESPAKPDSLCDGHVISVPVPAPEPDELRGQRRKLFADRDYLHARLELVATDEERLAMSLELLATAERIQHSYDMAAGRVVVPEAVPTIDLAAITDAGEIRRLLANLKPLRSKLKKRPDRADRLAEVEADIALLELKLKL